MKFGPTEKKVVIGTTVTGVVLLILACVLGWAVFPSVIEDQIVENTRLDRNTEQWERFEKLPVPVPLKLTLFEVQNAAEISFTGKPVVKEKGPYVYDQEKFKFNDTTVDGDFVTYRQSQKITFNKDASVGAETDIVKLPNIALLATLQMIEGMPIALPFDNYDEILQKMFGSLDSFVDITVQDLLFKGIEICQRDVIKGDLGAKLFCLFVRLMNLKNIKYNDDKSMFFSFLEFKDLKDDGVWKINGGFSDINQLGSLVSWNNLDYVDYWKHGKSSCNKVEGRDYTLFPPMLEEGVSFQIFTTDLCRKVNMLYEGLTEFKGIESYRFKAPKTMFVEEDAVSSCYCANKTKGADGEWNCFLDGILDLQSCYGVPLLASQPHFLNANSKYVNEVDGLKPDEELHNSYADIEPNTGSPLRGYQRMQFNLVLRPIKEPGSSDVYMGNTQNLPRVVMPILWVEQGVELSDDLVAELKSLFFDNLKIVEGVKWGLLGASIVIIVASVGYILYKKVKSK